MRLPLYHCAAHTGSTRLFAPAPKAHTLNQPAAHLLRARAGPLGTRPRRTAAGSRRHPEPAAQTEKSTLRTVQRMRKLPALPASSQQQESGSGQHNTASASPTTSPTHTCICPLPAPRTYHNPAHPPQSAVRPSGPPQHASLRAPPRGSAQGLRWTAASHHPPTRLQGRGQKKYTH